MIMLYAGNIDVVFEAAECRGGHSAGTKSEVQKTELAFIAHLCPFAAGPAVYKARTLYTLLDPMAQYYDRLMCVQNLGQNKNGNMGYVNLDSLYEAEGDKLGAVLLANNGHVQTPTHISIHDATALSTIILYPNPTQHEVFIKCDKGGAAIWILYNLLGQEIGRHEIDFTEKTKNIKLPDVSNGLYSYKIQFADEVFTGNLQVQK